MSPAARMQAKWSPKSRKSKNSPNGSPVSVARGDSRKESAKISGRRGVSGRKQDSRAGGSLVGSGSRRLLDQAELSDLAPMANEINTDISQFLNTKQTFNHSLTGVTHTSGGDKDGNTGDRDSNYAVSGGVGYNKNAGGKGGSMPPVNQQLLMNEFGPRAAAMGLAGSQLYAGGAA